MVHSIEIKYVYKIHAARILAWRSESIVFHSYVLRVHDEKGVRESKLSNKTKNKNDEQ